MDKDMSLPDAGIFAARERTSAPHALPYPTLPIRLALLVQRVIGWALIFPFCGLLAGLMYFVRGYRIENAAELRRRFKEITKDDTPLLICGNHLTYMDSAVMLLALGSLGWYARHWSKFSWNLPAGDFFKKRLVFRLVAYLTKCIFINRKGTRDHKNAILGICRYLLQRGEPVTIFPEGRRSRVGRFDVDHITFGVGKIIAGMPKCRVLCMYVRGHNQQGMTGYPPKGARFNILMEVIEPSTDKAGRHAHLDIAQQVAGAIHRLEGQYFGTAAERVVAS